MARAVRLLVVALSIAPATYAAAQSPSTDVDVGNIRRIEDISLSDLLDMPATSASKLEQPARETPALMSVVPRDQIDLYGWLSINDILFRQPGFSPSHDLNRQTVTARGYPESSGNNHLLLLIDGVPYNDNMFGTAYTWEVTPLFFVQTMEIIRGPGSALYGSNATNGVVAINSLSPDGSQPMGGAAARVGNSGTQIYDVWAGERFKLFSFFLGYNHHSTDGEAYDSYDGSGRTDANGKLAQFPVQDARSSDYAFLKLEGEGKLKGLSLQFHYQYWTFGSGHGFDFYIPDTKESLADNRQILSLAYRPEAMLKGKLKQEYVLQYQRHGMDWNAKFYPDNTAIGAITYPQGVSEALDTDAHQIFARAQYTWQFWREMNLLGGVEDSLFVYTGDSSHSSNADLNKGGSGLALTSTQGLRPWMQYVQNRPVDNFAVFLQASTGRIFKRIVSLTVGARYDLQAFNFVDPTDPTQTTVARNLSQVSPRVGLVLFPWRDLVIKAMFDRAFRAPSPVELFGVNTLINTSDPRNLQPESITTVGLGLEDLVTRFLDLRADWFYEDFGNEIANSVVNGNSSTNVYTRKVTGVEAEAIFDLAVGAAGKVSAFGNYTFVHLIDETIHDPTTLKSASLTWAPEHVFNLGAAFTHKRFSISAQGHFQGSVARRASDNTPNDYSAYRPATVAPWFTLDARVSYGVTSWLRLGVQGTNLTNTAGHMIKTHNYPFDYRIEGWRVLGTVELTLRGLTGG